MEDEYKKAVAEEKAAYKRRLAIQDKACEFWRYGFM